MRLYIFYYVPLKLRNDIVKKYILGVMLIGLLFFPVSTTHAVTLNDLTIGNYTVIEKDEIMTTYADNNIEVINGLTETPEIKMKLYVISTSHRSYAVSELLCHYYYDLNTKKIILATEQIYLINGRNGKVVSKTIYKNPKKVVLGPEYPAYPEAMYALKLAIETGQVNLVL